MNRWIFAALVCLTGVFGVRAHFVFIVPESADSAKCQIVFSDNLEPDPNVAISKIASTKLFLRQGNEEKALTTQEGKAALLLEVPGSGPRVVSGMTDYGIFQRGDNPAIWLRYFPKAIVGGIPTPEQAKLGEKAEIEIVPLVEVGKLRFQVLSQGKPLADAPCAVMLDGGKEKIPEAATNAQGFLATSFDKPGVYGVRALRKESKSGEHMGKKYAEIRSYATLVVHFGGK